MSQSPYCGKRKTKEQWDEMKPTKLKINYFSPSPRKVLPKTKPQNSNQTVPEARVEAQRVHQIAYISVDSKE